MHTTVSVVDGAEVAGVEVVDTEDVGVGPVGGPLR